MGNSHPSPKPPEVAEITHDDFPIKTFPPQGVIMLHYDNGSTETVVGTRDDYERLAIENDQPIKH